MSILNLSATGGAAAQAAVVPGASSAIGMAALVAMPARGQVNPAGTLSAISRGLAGGAARASGTTILAGLSRAAAKARPALALILPLPGVRASAVLTGANTPDLDAALMARGGGIASANAGSTARSALHAIGSAASRAKTSIALLLPLLARAMGAAKPAGPLSPLIPLAARAAGTAALTTAVAASSALTARASAMGRTLDSFLNTAAAVALTATASARSSARAAASFLGVINARGQASTRSYAAIGGAIALIARAGAKSRGFASAQLELLLVAAQSFAASMSRAPGGGVAVMAAKATAMGRAFGTSGAGLILIAAAGGAMSTARGAASAIAALSGRADTATRGGSAVLLGTAAIAASAIVRGTVQVGAACLAALATRSRAMSAIAAAVSFLAPLKVRIAAGSRAFGLSGLAPILFVARAAASAVGRAGILFPAALRGLLPGQSRANIGASHTIALAGRNVLSLRVVAPPKATAPLAAIVRTASRAWPNASFPIELASSAIARAMSWIGGVLGLYTPSTIGGDFKLTAPAGGGYIAQSFPTAIPSSTSNYGIDFIDCIDPGLALVSSTWSLKSKRVLPGAKHDPQANSHLATTLPGVNQTIAVQQISGLLAGNDYLVTVVAVLSDGEDVPAWAVIPCRDPSS